MSYQTIFEIGPIFHYVRNARKTMDVWGGSFLFSYLMGEIAHKIVEMENKTVEAIIKRPTLTDDPLYKWISEKKIPSGGIAAGSIPDQIFCLHQNENLPEKVKEEFQEMLSGLFTKCEKMLDNKYQCNKSKDSGRDNIISSQLIDYFRLFSVTKQIATSETSEISETWDDLEKAIASRGRAFHFDSFDDANNRVNSKREKCSLCGDYKRVLTLNKARRNNKNEQLCAVCTIKRGLLESFKEDIGLDTFHSTTSIAAKTVQKVLSENYGTIAQEIKQFAGKFIAGKKIDEEMSVSNWKKLNELKDNVNKNEIIEYLPYQQYFSDDNISIEFRNKIKEKLKSKIKDNEKVWLDSGYYAIVSVDGDNTGKLFQGANAEESKKISAAIAEYSGNAKSLIGKNGQLIYSGGEDILFIIHPIDVLKTIKEFSEKFKTCLKTVAGDGHPLTISAGVYICPHKHPLKLALKGAEEMIGKAKDIENKNTVYIKLVKGVGEVNDSYFKIRDNGSGWSLGDFNTLVEAYKEKGIPRGFVYKLKIDYTVFSEIIEDDAQLLQYSEDMFLKTRQEGMIFDENLKNLIKYSAKTGDKGKFNYYQLIERLYLARFLTGGE